MSLAAVLDGAGVLARGFVCASLEGVHANGTGMMRRRACFIVAATLMVSGASPASAQGFGFVVGPDILLSLLKLFLERGDAEQQRRTKDALPTIIEGFHEIAKLKDQLGRLGPSVIALIGQPCQMQCNDTLEVLRTIQNDLSGHLRKVDTAIATLDITLRARNLELIDVVRSTSSSRSANIANLERIVLTTSGARVGDVMSTSAAESFFHRQPKEAEEIRMLVRNLQELLPKP